MESSVSVTAVQVSAAWLAMARALATRTRRSACAMTAGTAKPVNYRTALASPIATIMVRVFCSHIKFIYC